MECKMPRGSSRAAGASSFQGRAGESARAVGIAGPLPRIRSGRPRDLDARRTGRLDAGPGLEAGRGGATVAAPPARPDSHPAWSIAGDVAGISAAAGALRASAIGGARTSAAAIAGGDGPGSRDRTSL